MVAIPLGLFAMAAGVYLLVLIKRESAGRATQAAAWLVIFLSLLFILFAANGIRHRMMMRHFRQHEKGMCCHERNERCCPYMKCDTSMMNKAGCDSTMRRGGCPMMEHGGNAPMCHGHGSGMMGGERKCHGEMHEPKE